MAFTSGAFPLRRFMSHFCMLALAILAFVFACEPTKQNPAVPTETATIAVSKSYRSLLVVVALVKGYFQEEGLQVAPRMHAYGKLSLEDMMAGKADFAIAAETPVMFAIMDGAEISIIATIHKSNKDHAIVVRKDKGVFTPGDLKGKKIATTFGITTDFFLDTFLAINAIRSRDVELINLRQEELSQALAEGQVDAISVVEPFLKRSQKQLGDRAAAFFNKNIYTQSVSIVTTKEMIRLKPEKIGKLLRALRRAENFFKQNPEEAVKIAADYLQEEVADVRGNLAGTTVELSLDETILLNLEDQSRWAVESGRTSAGKIPDYLDHIYTDGLKSVNPAAVRILE